MTCHRSSRKKRLAIVGLLVVVVLAVAASEVPARRSPFQPLTIFARALAYIEVNYVEPIDQKSLVYGAIRGLTSVLDPHSMFLDPEEYAILESDSEGRFAGVGVEVSMRDGWLTILSVFEGGPAAHAGLKPGDRFLAIEGKDARDIRLYEAVRMIRGEPGSDVTVTLRREAREKAIERTLKRAFIDVDPVELRYLEDGVVYVRIAAFQERTAALLREALDEAVVRLRRKGGVQGLLLDLRDNGGGLLREAVLVSDEFLNSGVILTTRGRSGDLVREFEARRGGTRPKWPIVILINAQTASAAEIVAGALSDQDRAVLVGTRTFGKGSVQNLFELPDGSALKLTIALYYTPSGRSIQAEGISPDVVAEQPAEDGEPFAVREEELDRHLRARPVAEASRASRRAAALRMPTGPSSPSLAGDLQAELGYQVLQELIRQ